MWEAPGPPGADVTHVRDRRGVVWRREAGVWWGDVGHGYDTPRTWWELLARGPLTEVTP